MLPTSGPGGPLVLSIVAVILPPPAAQMFPEETTEWGGGLDLNCLEHARHA